MSTLNGIHDAQYLAQFLGHKIAVRDAQNPNKYSIYPELYVICSDKTVIVKNKWGKLDIFTWEQCESPYVILQSDVEIEIK